MGDTLQASYRQAMRSLTSAVCVVTTRYREHRFGMTATSVTSLSMSPPALLFCVNASASLHDPVVGSGRFCVNILDAAQEHLAQDFGGKLAGEDRFKGGVWSEGDHREPCLDDAQANVFCRVDAVHGYATHSIVIGLVSEVRVRGTVTPLLYQDGRYTVGLGDGIDWVVSIGG
jgi:flavin reductase (DIM6/NTAB) family NADH-FMN oxidoreductase RutF